MTLSELEVAIFCGYKNLKVHKTIYFWKVHRNHIYFLNQKSISYYLTLEMTFETGF